MSRWLFFALVGSSLAALPAHGGIERTGDPAISVHASQPSAPAGPETRTRQDRRRVPESVDDLRQSRSPERPRQRDGICAATSICETH